MFRFKDINGLFEPKTKEKFIEDVFFGGAEKDAAKAQQAGIESGIKATQDAVRKAEGQLFDIFPQAQQTAQQGFQGALDVFGQSLPAQVNAFQQGNMGAQEAILAGLPQIQNALFGNQVDLSGIQPFQVQQPDLGFFNQTLPQLQEQGPTNTAFGGSEVGFFGPNNQYTTPTQGGMSQYLGGGRNSDFFRRSIF